MLLAIDPGNVESAWILYDNENKMPDDFAKEINQDVSMRFENFRTKTDTLAIEMIASYGMPVGESVFQTCVWIGRYAQLWESLGGKAHFLFRKDVKMALCHTMKAKDSNIRQAIMDRYGSTREAAIGTKKDPKACYGISKDVWAAFGVAITFAETKHKLV